jgi:hypothetical protein
VIAEAIRQLAIKTLELVKDFEPYVQHSIFEKYLGHVLLKNVVPKYNSSLASLKFSQKVLSNMKSGIIKHLVSSSVMTLTLSSRSRQRHGKVQAKFTTWKSHSDSWECGKA